MLALVHLLKCNDVVTRLHVGDALSHRLDDAGTFVTQDNGEGSLGVLAGQRVRICVADTCVVNLDTDLMGPGRSDLDVLDGKVLAGFPGNGGLSMLSESRA